MTVQDRVRQFIIEDLRFAGTPDELSDDLPLITNGIIDSLGVYELVGIIEVEYGVRVEDHEVLPSNLGSLGSIAAFVETKRAT